MLLSTGQCGGKFSLVAPHVDCPSCRSASVGFNEYLINVVCNNRIKVEGASKRRAPYPFPGEMVSPDLDR